MRQKASEEISNALKNYNNSLSYANSDYIDYINNEIILIQTMSKLIDNQIYYDHLITNSLYPGQEVAGPNMMMKNINQLKSDISKYKNNESNIVTKDLDKFKFLN